MSLLLSPTPSSPIPPALYPSPLSLSYYTALSVTFTPLPCFLHPARLTHFSSRSPCHLPAAIVSSQPPCCSSSRCFFLRFPAHHSSLSQRLSCTHLSLRAPSLPPSSAGWCFPACSDYYREHVRRFFACCDDVAPGLQSPSHTKGMSGSRGRYKDSR